MPQKLGPTHLSILACLAVISCQSAKLYHGPSALETGNWHKIKDVPPTYYPKGISPDHPTDYQDGYWVHAGDQADTRFFIPLNGNQDHSAKQLIAEAHAAMDKSKKRKLRTELMTESGAEGATELAKELVKLGLGILGGMSSGH